MMAPRTMKALNYVGPFNVKVQEVEMPRLEHPDDIIVKITSVRPHSHSFACDADCTRPPFVVQISSESNRNPGCLEGYSPTAVCMKGEQQQRLALRSVGLGKHPCSSAALTFVPRTREPRHCRRARRWSDTA
jgi:hypothetical protein